MWTYEDTWWDGWPTSRWTVTVRMPLGATVVGENPKPYMRGGDGDAGGRPFVGFEGTVVWEHQWDKFEKASWKVQYRLGEKAAGTGP